MINIKVSALRQMHEDGSLSFYPELYDCVAVKEDNDITVFDHVCLTCNALIPLIQEAGITDIETSRSLFLAAICHDMGKAVVGDVRHEEAGEELVLSFLKAIGAPQRIIEKVLPLCLNHNRFDLPPKQLISRLGKATTDELFLLMKADKQGHTTPRPLDNVYALEEAVHAYKESLVRPPSLLRGTHLAGLGVESGPGMGQVLQEAKQAQLEGCFSTETTAIEWAQDLILKKKRKENDIQVKQKHDPRRVP